MSSEIRLYEAGGTADPDNDLRFRWENTINTPINSATYLADGEAVSDVYTVAATSASTVNVTAEDPKSEVEGTGLSVTADDATVNYGIVPGVGIVFSSSLASGWTAKVSIGALMTSGGVTSDRLNVGTVEAGDVSTQRKIAALNVGTEDSVETALYALPGFFLEDDAQPYILRLQNHTDPTRHTLATPDDLDITYADYQSGATPPTVDVYVDAVKAIEDAKLDGATLYQYGESNGYIDAQDKFKGMGIILADDPGDPTSQTHTYHVRDGWEWVEVAPDVSGSPGTWQSPPLTLTESGETSGTITAGGYALFWVRLNVPASASPGDRRLYVLRARGLTV